MPPPGPPRRGSAPSGRECWAWRRSRPDGQLLRRRRHVARGRAPLPGDPRSPGGGPAAVHAGARPDHGGPRGGDRQPGRGQGALDRPPAGRRRASGRCSWCTPSAATCSSCARSHCASTPTGPCTGSRRWGSTRARPRRPASRRWRPAYVDTIRSVQPTGPYDLAGHSFGGLVAFEMARTSPRRASAWAGSAGGHPRGSGVPSPGRPARVSRARPFRFVAAALRAPPAARRYAARRFSASRRGRRCPHPRPSGRSRLCSTGSSGSAWRRSPSTARAPTRATQPCSWRSSVSRTPATRCPSRWSRRRGRARARARPGRASQPGRGTSRRRARRARDREASLVPVERLRIGADPVSPPMPSIASTSSSLSSKSKMSKFCFRRSGFCDFGNTMLPRWSANAGSPGRVCRAVRRSGRSPRCRGRPCDPAGSTPRWRCRARHRGAGRTGPGRVHLDLVDRRHHIGLGDQPA